VTALARDLARALDPVALAVDVGMCPDPWQRDVRPPGHSQGPVRARPRARRPTVGEAAPRSQRWRSNG